MTHREGSKLQNGVYRIYWKKGGFSLASIGRMHDGTMWIAPCNWIYRGNTCNIPQGNDHWRSIERVELIEAWQYQPPIPPSQEYKPHNPSLHSDRPNYGIDESL